MATSDGRTYRRICRRGFSLVELVIVVVILGVIASIAVPRMTNASTSASANALHTTLSNVRKAIDRYYAEHDRYPGYHPVSKAASNAAFIDQLTLYSDYGGNTSSTPSSTYNRGPYLRRPFPANPFNELTTVYVKADPGTPDPGAGTAGWITVLSHGYFGIHATDEELDDIGLNKLEDKKAVKGDASIG